MFRIFEVGEEVINLRTGLAGYIQSIDHDSGLAIVKWIQPGVAISTEPVGRLMNSTDHLRMVREQEIEPYRPALMEVANRWRYSKESER